MTDERKTYFVRKPGLARLFREEGYEEIPAEMEGLFGFKQPIVTCSELLALAAQSEQVH
jgi:hypothetical protein